MKYLLSLPLFLLLVLFILPSSASAQNCDTGNPNTARVTEGLISTPVLNQSSSIFYNTVTNGTSSCVINTPQAAFIPFKIPSYADLKSNFFTKIRATDPKRYKQEISGDVTSLETAIVGPTGSAKDATILVNGSVLINESDRILAFTNIKSALVFIEGDLFIKSPSQTINTLYYGALNGNPETGIIFVVKGNIYFDTPLIHADGVFVSAGTICTAATGTDLATRTCPNDNYTNPVDTKTLTISGSLISINTTAEVLNPTSNIRFRRWVGEEDPSSPGNSRPGEIVTQQAKYMVVLNNLFTLPFTQTSEDTNYSINLGVQESQFQYTIDDLTPITAAKESEINLTLSLNKSVGTPEPRLIKFEVDDPATGRKVDGSDPASNAFTLFPTQITCFTNSGSDSCAPVVTIRINPSATEGTNKYIFRVEGAGVPVQVKTANITVLAAASLSFNTPLGNIAGDSNLDIIPTQKATITWSGNPFPQNTDYIQVYYRDLGQPSPRSANKKYLMSGTDCKLTSPGIVSSGGSCFFQIDEFTEQGVYEFRLFSNNGALMVRRSAAFTVLRSPQLTVYKQGTTQSSINRSEIAEVRWYSNPSFSATDAVYMYTVGAPNKGWLVQLPTSSPQCTITGQGIDGVCTFTIPPSASTTNFLPSGPFKFRILPNDNNSTPISLESNTVTVP